MRIALLFTGMFLLTSIASTAIAVEPSSSKIQPISHAKLTPGKSSIENVLKAYGQPYSRTTSGASTTLEFGDKDYDIALITITNDRVEAIALVPTKPRSLESVAEKFGLNKFSPTAIYDENNSPIGLVIPERGILLGLSNNDGLKVQEILLGVIDGEPFYLRAAQDKGWRLRRNLDDLKLAARYGYSRGKCLALTARYLELAGESQKAFSVAEQGVDEAPRLLRARLQLAALMPLFGKGKEAATIANSVFKSPEATEFEKTWAECIAASQIAKAAVLPEEKYNPRQSVEAMETATENLKQYLDNSPVEIRSLARDIQIRTNLSLMDIYSAMGAVKRTALKRMCYEELKRAKKNSVDDGGNPIMAARIVAHVSKIRHQQGWSDLETENAEILRALAQRVKSSQDPLLTQALQLEMSTALLRISHHAKSLDEITDAVAATNNALGLLKKINNPKSASPRFARVKGEALYTAGLLKVVTKKDHLAATKAYDQARTWLNNAPSRSAASTAQLGDIWVSMGISYWQSGDQEQAVKDTLLGLKLLKQAVATNTVGRSVLQVPFTNLETMYRKLGQNDRAQHYRLELANLKKTGTRLR